MLVLHLVPDGVGTFDARLDFILQSHLVQLFADGGCEIGEELVALLLCQFEFLLNGTIGVGMFVLEAEVFQFCLDFVQSEAVCQRGIDVECFTGNLVLLVGWLRLQGAHVVQTVADFDEDDADVIAHGEQQFLEVLCLCRCLFAEDASTDFGQTFHYLCYLRSEDVLNVLGGVVGVFHHVVEQCRTDARRTETYLLRCNLCHGDGVHDIWFARQAAHTLMCLSCKVECFGDDIYLLAVARVQVGVQ